MNANGKNYGGTVILKAQGIQNSLFCISTPKETKNTGIYLLYFRWAVNRHFFSQVFAFTLVVGIIWKKKTYPAMDLIVYGEANGAVIVVED